MGKWATYRKRGSGSQSSAALSAPPAPAISIVDGDIVITSTSAPEASGILELWADTGAGGTWIVARIFPWGTGSATDSSGDFSGFSVKAAQLGGDDVYSGRSAFSATLGPL